MKTFLKSMPLIALCCASSAAWASFDFTLLPDRGGRDIRFTPMKPGEEARNEEATLTVVNDEGRRYRISQQQMSPFVNERGQILSNGAIKVFSPTSTGGRLGIVFPTALEQGQTVIFDSDNAGTAETFALVYAAQFAPNDAAGRYTAEIVYQMEAVDGGAAPVTLVMRVLVEVRPDFFLQVKSVNGGSSLKLGKISRQQLAGTGALQVTVGAGLGGRYRIYQRLTDRVTNSLGQELTDGKINFAASKADLGQVVAQEQPLTTIKTLVYESDDAGSAATFAVEYRTDDMGSALAGSYRSNLEFIVESEMSANFAAPVVIPLEMEVETIFFLDVEHESAGGLNFGKFKNEGDRQSRRVRVQAHNNTGQRYQVLQRVSRPFTNENGKSLSKENFMAIMSGAQSGEMKIMEDTPVEPGDTVIYTADTDGSSDDFVIDYTLTLPRDTSGGEYTSETTYSLAPVS